MTKENILYCLPNSERGLANAQRAVAATENEIEKTGNDGGKYAAEKIVLLRKKLQGQRLDVSDWGHEVNHLKEKLKLWQ